MLWQNIFVERAAASDDYENDLQQPGFGTATSRFNRRASVCLRSTILLALRQVVIFLTILLLLIGYDHYTLDPKAFPSHDLGHCSHDSDASIPFYTVNGTDDFPTCKGEEEEEEEEEWNFACCYNSAFQRDFLSSTTAFSEGTFH